MTKGPKILRKIPRRKPCYKYAPQGCGGIAQAGWKGRTGCEPLEAESPYLQKMIA